MNRLALVVFAAAIVLAALSPQKADARVFVGVGIGGCCYSGGWGGYGYPYYYRPYYPAYYPPPVVYAPPLVVYSPAPAPITYGVPPAVPADQTSPTFVDGLGRTCRQYQTMVSGSTGTACLQTDGTWRVTQ